MILYDQHLHSCHSVDSEAQRVAIRNTRRDANKRIDTEDKEGTLPEDEADKAKETVQELTTRFEKQVDDLLAAKTKEIQEV